MASDSGEHADTPPPADPIVGEARKGSLDAVSRAVESFRPYLQTIGNQELERDLRGEESVSDLVQETLFDAQRKFDTFQGRSQKELKYWLVGILRNKLREFRRRLLRPMRDVRRQTPLEFVEHVERSGTPSPVSEAIKRERRQLVQTARQRLPERERNVVEWYIGEGCTFEEIGRRLDCSLVTARNIWLRALDLLALELAAIQDESDMGSLRNPR